MGRGLVLCTVLVLAAGGCSLLVDTGGLSNGSPQPDGGSLADASPADAPSSDGVAGDGAVGPDGATSTLLDSFARPDGPIGNGWIEKTPGNSVIKDGEVFLVKAGVYHDSIVRRPASEDLLDVEVSIACRVSSFVSAFPQVHARLQSSTAGIPGTLDSYAFFLNAAPDSVTLASTHGTMDSVALMNLTLSTALTTADRFRLKMRITGTSPVRLEVSVDRVDGASLTTLAHGIYLDSGPTRITAPGSVGFSSHDGSGFTYDDFRRDGL